MSDLYQKAINIAEVVRDVGGRALVVGGYARDEMMRRAGSEVGSKDIDLEVYGVEKATLEQLLGQFGQVLTIGKQYQVFHVDGVDVALPRREQQIGKGHRDLETEYDPKMSFEEAFRRRDFTINAVGIDPLTDEVIDLYGGVSDIKDKILRMVDSETFGDDPLRPLRGAQLAGRLELTLDSDTVQVAQSVVMNSLPATRVGEEWHKLLTKSPKPSIGLEAMHRLGVIRQLHSELEPAVLDQKTLDLIDQATSDLVETEHIEFADRLLMILCRNLGEPAQGFLNSLEISQKRIARIVSVTREYGRNDIRKDVTDTLVRNLSSDIHPASIRDLVWLLELEEQGSASNLLETAERLGVTDHRPELILTGDHLIKLGFLEGPKLGQILKKVYQAQLDGEVSNLEEAKKYATNI